MADFFGLFEGIGGISSTPWFSTSSQPSSASSQPTTQETAWFDSNFLTNLVNQGFSLAGTWMKTDAAVKVADAQVRSNSPVVQMGPLTSNFSGLLMLGLVGVGVVLLLRK